MEILVAICIGALTSGGIYLILRPHSFSMILGFSLLSYAVNIFLFVSGRLTVGQLPIIDPTVNTYADPLPQALVLTAIVIAFGMTAVLIAMALGSYFQRGDDLTNTQLDAEK
jgi:multicomponent K+:H+ antiporter subunit C